MLTGRGTEVSEDRLFFRYSCAGAEAGLQETQERLTRHIYAVQGTMAGLLPVSPQSLLASLPLNHRNYQKMLSKSSIGTSLLDPASYQIQIPHGLV